MIPRITIEAAGSGLCDYAVSYEAEELFADTGLGSVLECLVAAVEGLPPEVKAVEIAYDGFVSGTYGLEIIALNPQPIADHAVNTAAAVREALAS